MTWYAETSGRRSRQVVGDVAALLWVVLWLLVARWVFDLTRVLAAPADPLRRAGSAWTDRLSEVAERAGEVPLVGDGLAESLASAAAAGDNLTAAGNQLDEGVTGLAWLLSLAVLVLPLLLVAGYALLRWRWARQATAVARGREVSTGQELLALRALVHQSPTALRAVSEDPLSGWRSGDREVVEGLAGLELRRFGLRSRPVGSAHDAV